LALAIAATFARRQTAIPTNRPDALTPAFAEDPLKQRQWAAFIADIDHAPRQLALVVDDLAPFLMDSAAMAHRQALPWRHALCGGKGRVANERPIDRNGGIGRVRSFASSET
jgi:hypothetical protein